MEPILLILNLGTHGFYPFPGIFRRQYNMFVEYKSVAAEPKCYPEMLHVYLVDILIFLINLIWLRIVVSYVGALHKKNPDPMRMFFSLSIVKVVMQVMYFGYQPHIFDMLKAETYWFLKILDIFIALACLVMVHKYTKALRLEKAGVSVEKPPSYIECLISANLQGASPRYGVDVEKKDEVTTIDEKRPSQEPLKVNEETSENTSK
ncbi:hypothetical protein O3G_MSEX005343 [Manduca sexta]|uniref:Uncharacterized protein n=2 Tax=Manduca sexta TaxID=7130 RepID=A0A921YZD7_MANSE|nr:hypothetical protein O3G_MSEX005343 [Manduca sexta]